MTIKLIRMWSGEDVIADVIEENEYTITMAVSYTHLTLPTMS